MSLGGVKKHFISNEITAQQHNGPVSACAFLGAEESWIFHFYSLSGTQRIKKKNCESSIPTCVLSDNNNLINSHPYSYQKAVKYYQIVCKQNITTVRYDTG